MDAKLIHLLDRLGEDLKPVVNVLGTYHRALVAEGFSRDEATQITMGLQKTIFAVLLERVNLHA